MSNVNPYSLILSGLGAENFSVISFLSRNLLFNSDYSLKIVFKRHNTIDLSSCIKKPAYLKTDKNIIHG